MTIPRDKPEKMETGNVRQLLDKAVDVAVKKPLSGRLKRIGRPSPASDRESVGFNFSGELLEKLDVAMSEDKREVKKRLELPIDRSYYVELLLTKALNDRDAHRRNFLDYICTFSDM